MREIALATLWGILLFLPASKVEADRRIWRVRSGDALSILAQRFHVSVDEIRQWNNLEGDRIFVGQELIVSSAENREQNGVETQNGLTHRVQSGETLSHIALHYDLSIDDLITLNPGLNADRIREGQTLHVSPDANRQSIHYVIRSGDNLSRIAKRHRVELHDLLRWNRNIHRNHLRIGQTLLILSDIPESRSESKGAPYRGSLEYAEQLPRHPGYFIRNAQRSYGTLETILWLQDAFDAVLARHPGSPRIRIHDISLEHGGPMSGHRSHQSGRDVDLSYFQKRCGRQPCPMRRVRPEHLDATRQWTLFEHWLKNERIDAIFVDYQLQRPLFEAARRAGYSRSELSRWIQYPRGPNFPFGIIRHFPQHHDHAHVRFVCPDTDSECR